MLGIYFNQLFSRRFPAQDPDRGFWNREVRSQEIDNGAIGFAISCRRMDVRL
jgi:hypothetical protein